jgi:TadE-like protein
VLFASQIKMTLPLKNRLGSRRGNAMIEFALASFVLIPLFIGTFQFGYTFYVYNLLCTQMRAGARYASLKTFKGSDVSGFKTAVQNMVMYDNPEPWAAHVLISFQGKIGNASANTTKALSVVML